MGQVFAGYWDVLNPVNAINGAVTLYQLGRACGVGAAGAALGQGLYHGFTDWLTTDDPRAFGQSFGTVLLTAASVAGPKASCFFKCFPAGTPVQMADGTTKPIEQVKVGDTVWSRDPDSKKTEAKKVVGTRVRQSTELVTLRLAERDTGRVVDTLRATPEHPFFVEGKGVTPAGQLSVGEALATRAGPALLVQAISKEEISVPVYNFTVDGDHTYFVGTAHGGTWVHNYDDPVLEPLDAIPYDQHPSSRPLGPDAGSGDYVYVRDTNGIVHIADDGSHMHPKVLGGGQPATGAGTLTIGPDGIITRLDNISGTFKFGPESLQSVANSIGRQGVGVAPGAMN